MAEVLDHSLRDAVALVTGAKGGIGSHMCAALAAQGVHVVGTDLGDEPAETAAELWLRHDVTSPDDWARVVEQIESRYGRLDCLVNNAGVGPVDRIEDTTLEQWRWVQSVNVESILIGLQATLPVLRKSGTLRRGGASVVNVSSTAGLRGVGFMAAYSASKGAVKLLTKSAAREFAALGYPIRVNSLHPGVTGTDMMDSITKRYVEIGAATSAEEAARGWAERTPLGRMGAPAEVAAAVVWLCSPAASFVTGTETVVDGGGSA